MSHRNFSHNSNFIFQTNLFENDTFFYYLQECNLPGLSFSHIEMPKNAVLGNIQGDTITYSPLSISIIIDEKLETWKNIINVAQKMRNPVSSTGEPISKWGHLTIQDDNTNQVVKLEFRDMMLESISDLTYSTTSEDEIITCTVDIKYDFYTIF